jgi:hypothetical protein
MARATVPTGAQLVMIGPDGEIARGARELSREVPADRPAAYRVEARLPSAPGHPPVPWLVSNPVYVANFGAAVPMEPASPLARDGQFPWRIEKDPASSAILRTPELRGELEYHLADGPRGGQFVALASDLRGQAFSAIDLTMAADRPTRMAVQVRTADGRRWGRSYYVDPAGTAVHAVLSEFRPVGIQETAVPSPESLTSVLLVVDLTNAVPGHAGRLIVRSSALVK